MFIELLNINPVRVWLHKIRGNLRNIIKLENFFKILYRIQMRLRINFTSKKVSVFIRISIKKYYARQ